MCLEISTREPKLILFVNIRVGPLIRCSAGGIFIKKVNMDVSFGPSRREREEKKINGDMQGGGGRKEEKNRGGGEKI